MDVDELRARLDRCLDEKQPVLKVVAVVGSTEESVVDPPGGSAAHRVAWVEFMRKDRGPNDDHTVR